MDDPSPRSTIPPEQRIRVRQRARQRALRALAQRHADEFESLHQRIKAEAFGEAAEQATDDTVAA